MRAWTCHWLHGSSGVEWTRRDEQQRLCSTPTTREQHEPASVSPRRSSLVASSADTRSLARSSLAPSLSPSPHSMFHPTRYSHSSALPPWKARPLTPRSSFSPPLHRGGTRSAPLLSTTTLEHVLTDSARTAQIGVARVTSSGQTSRPCVPSPLLLLPLRPPHSPLHTGQGPRVLPRTQPQSPRRTLAERQGPHLVQQGQGGRRRRARARPPRGAQKGQGGRGGCPRRGTVRSLSLPNPPSEPADPQDACPAAASPRPRALPPQPRPQPPPRHPPTRTKPSSTRRVARPSATPRRRRGALSARGAARRGPRARATTTTMVSGSAPARMTTTATTTTTTTGNTTGRRGGTGTGTGAARL